MIEATLILGGPRVIIRRWLALAAKYLEVYEDERINEVEKLLPNYNCGACGTPGCHAFATEIVTGIVGNISRCKPGKVDKHLTQFLNT